MKGVPTWMREESLYSESNEELKEAKIFKINQGKVKEEEGIFPKSD